MSKEYAIGEKFFKNGVLLEVKEGDSLCGECVFINDSCCDNHRCWKENRSDHKDVIFVRVKSMNNKPKIYTFDPVIYPRMVWIAITTDNVEGFSNVSKMDDSMKAVIDEVHDNNNFGGVLIRFASLEDMSTDTIAHEACHAAFSILNYVGVINDYDNQEAFCYVVEWVTKCCEEVKQKESFNK